MAPVPATEGDAAAGSSNAASGWPRWEVTTRPAAGEQQAAAAAAAGSGGSEQRQLYDAVVVCNGHYWRPRLPALPGQDVFPGQQLHSHNFRRPEGFVGQTVVLLGASSSGVDIAEEIMRAGAAR